jgi:hypothetical protein
MNQCRPSKGSLSILTPHVNISTRHDAMNERIRSDLENTCCRLIKESRDLLFWEWDGRFGTALTQFSVDDMSGVLEIVHRHLVTAWDRTNIDVAPGLVKDITRGLGGLKPGQILYTSDPAVDAVLFGAWWPWNNGKKISIRIGQFCAKLTDAENDKLNLLLKCWFGL